MTQIFRSEAGKALVHAQYRSMLQDWPVPHREAQVPTCHGETFVISCGPDSAPPVLLLHGGATTSAMWLRNVRAWSQRFRIHAVDLIGEPGFSAPSRPPLRSEEYARWLDDIWSALSITRAAIVGASLGGLFALDYAIRRPGKVEKLALLAPAGIARVRARCLLTAVPLFLLGRRGRRKAFDLVMRFPAEEMSAEAEGFIRFFEAVMSHHRVRTQPLPILPDAMLQKLTMPVLAILGGKDIVFSAEEMRRRLEACVPRARIVLLPSAGHGLTDPTQTVLEFLTSAAA
jgi:pimeloyl-ACP methyl ester carboxylesterase